MFQVTDNARHKPNSSVSLLGPNEELVLVEEYASKGDLFSLLNREELSEEQLRRFANNIVR